MKTRETGIAAALMRGMPQAQPWDAVDALRVQENIAGGDVPASAFTVKDYADRYKLGYRTAVNQLRILAARGKMQTGMRVGACQGGRHCLLRVYWPI